jgi:hypothetical protein
MKNEKNAVEILICGLPQATFNNLEKHIQTAMIKADKASKTQTNEKTKEKEAKEADKVKRANEISQLNEVNKSIFQAVKMVQTAKVAKVGKDGKEVESTIVSREQVKSVVKAKNFNPVQLLGVSNVGAIFDKLRNGNSYSINEVYRLCEKMHAQKLDSNLQRMQNDKASKIFNVAKLHRLGELTTSEAIKQLIDLVGQPIKTDKEGKKSSLLAKSFVSWLYINHREEYEGLYLYRFFPTLSAELQAKQAEKVAIKAKDFDKTLNVETVSKSLVSVDLYTVEALNTYKVGDNALKAFISKYLNLWLSLQGVA